MGRCNLPKMSISSDTGAIARKMYHSGPSHILHCCRKSNLQRRDDSWFTLASNKLGISESVLREHPMRGDSLSLASPHALPSSTPSSHQSRQARLEPAFRLLNFRAGLVGRCHAANPPPFTPESQVCLYASPTYQQPWYLRQSHYHVGELGCGTDTSRFPKRSQSHINLLRR
ncbi:hypothetical protein EI94DRAFT_435147 [Lactarius quietus]|nr:hypothetical protein EI94DRAFT_435147 [Lactarius quietus]